MNASQLFQQAVVNFTAAKLRSFLAVLGVLVGTAAVVTLLSSGQLATDKALAEFKTLGTDLITISAYQNKTSNPSQPHEALHASQWYSLVDHIPGITIIAPYTTTYQPISYQGYEFQAPILAADESLADIVHITIQAGHFVSFVDSFEHYCVLGATLAQQIQAKDGQPPIGRQIKIESKLYTIIGIVNVWKDNPFFNEDINRAIIIPLRGIALITQEQHITNAILKIKPNTPIDSTVDQLHSAITRLVPNHIVYIRSAKQMIASMQSQGHIFTLLLTVIGSISLLVGGIGIMNVMLVAVSERKKEIGIRKAVGATQQDIQYLFLVESALLAMSGGGLGILLGETITFGIAFFSHWPFTFYWLPPLAGFSVSALSGIFFGYYPAQRAAKLDPIVCLRSE